MENKETTDKIPTALDLQKEAGHHFIMNRPYTDTNVAQLMVKFAQLHLTKQAEVIAEKWFIERTLKSIREASEEYKKTIK